MQIYNIVVWLLYNAVFNAKYIVLKLIQRIHAFLISFFITYHNNSFLDNIQINREYLLKHKLPHHIAFLLIDEEPSYIDLSKLILWSICFKIYQITLFDPKEKLKHEIKICISSLYDCNFSSFDVYYKILNETEKLSQRNGHSNKIAIYISDSSDGYKMINELCIKYSKNSKNIDINLPTFVSDINAIYPEPNLAIKFGGISCFTGFLPWHLRFTEIISLHSHKNLSYRQFFECLCNYAKCQQNYGK